MGPVHRAASLLTLEGHVFYTRTIRLGKANRAWFPGHYPQGDAMFLLPEASVELSPHRSYVLQTEVSRPSERSSDKQQVEACARF